MWSFYSNNQSNSSLRLRKFKQCVYKIFFEEGYFQASTNPFKIKPNFSTLGSIIEISSNILGSQNVLTLDHSIKDLLGFKAEVKHEVFDLWDYPVDILGFGNFFQERDISQGL